MSLIQSKCIFLKFIIPGRGLCPLPKPHHHHFSKLNFISDILHITVQISVYQESTKINTQVNERLLKNIGTHWNIRHRLFQRVPVSFSLAPNFIHPTVAANLRSYVVCDNYMENQ